MGKPGAVPGNGPNPPPTAGGFVRRARLVVVAPVRGSGGGDCPVRSAAVSRGRAPLIGCPPAGPELGRVGGRRRTSPSPHSDRRAGPRNTRRPRSRDSGRPATPPAARCRRGDLNRRGPSNCADSHIAVPTQHIIGGGRNAHRACSAARPGGANPAAARSVGVVERPLLGGVRVTQLTEDPMPVAADRIPRGRRASASYKSPA